MPNPPLLLVDNVFDAVNLYPGAVIDATTEAVGHEAFRVADYRRDRTWWQAANDVGVGSLHRIRVHLPAAVSPDFLFLDRGHNLAGKSITLLGGDDGSTWLHSVTPTVPSAVGGSPTSPSMCQTEEGAAFTLFTALPAHAWWELGIPATGGFIPVVTGLIVGARTQLVGYSNTFDEDAGARTQPSTQSTAGYRANDRTYSWRTVTLGLELIGAPTYDAQIRTLRSQLFDLNQPFVCAMDYGTHPERAWMYTLDGTTWGMPKSRVYRAGRIVGREHMPRLV
jgi:hypothetical protein